LIRYSSNSFPSDFIPTIFGGFAVTVMVEGHQVNLGVFDTAGECHKLHVHVGCTLCHMPLIYISNMCSVFLPS
jgi:hypothetical protein